MFSKKAGAHKATKSSAARIGTAVLAGGIGFGLLASGGGTFATWTKDATIDGVTITAGEAFITARTPEGTWTIGEETVDPSEIAIIPGATLTYTNQLEITAVGRGLNAELTSNINKVLDEATGIEGLSADFDITVGGAPVNEFAGFYGVPNQPGVPITDSDKTQYVDIVGWVTIPTNAEAGTVLTVPNVQFFLKQNVRASS